MLWQFLSVIRDLQKSVLKPPLLCSFMNNFVDIIYIYMKSSFPKRYKSILIVFMKIKNIYLDPYILLIFNLSC